MVIYIPAKSKTSWVDSAQLIMNTACRVFRSGSEYYDSISVESYDRYQDGVYSVLAISLFKKRDFIRKVQILLEGEFATITLGEYSWVIEINLDLLFNVYTLKTTSENIFLHYGQDKAGIGAVIKKSQRFRPSDWYNAVEYAYGNGVKYYPNDKAPKTIEDLPSGYRLENNPPGHIDGWGVGFKGGSYLVSK